MVIVDTENTLKYVRIIDMSDQVKNQLLNTEKNTKIDLDDVDDVRTEVTTQISGQVPGNVVKFPANTNIARQTDVIDFVHLRVHSEYSLSDSTLTIKKMIGRAKTEKMPAIALTDFNNLFAYIKFYKAARKAGIKPIAGVDILLANEGVRKWSLTLLAKNDEGYRNIIQLISLAYTEGQESGMPIISEQWLEQYSAGLIVLSGAQQGDIGFYLEQEQIGKARERVRKYQQFWGDDFFIELQRVGKDGEVNYIQAAIELAAGTSTPVVATNDVRFEKIDDYEAHEVRVCIANGEVINDSSRKSRYFPTQYLCSVEEMRLRFADIPQALANTVEIAKRCNVITELGKSDLPRFVTDENKSEGDLLRELTYKGLESRLSQLYVITDASFSATRQRYIERLQWELDTIIKMGFPGYFLIVMDFIRWSKENGIPVGPGRGSGAGSLVAYSLDITNLDPLKYGLLFERFLNPERVSMPDFDIDFCIEGRDDVINYVSEKYGKAAVSQIITFGTMAAKAVIRDVARVMGKPYGLADNIAKLIPFTPGVTLKEALESEPELSKLLSNNFEAVEIWDMALQLEGLARNCGKHAGGVLIAPSNLLDYTPIYSDGKDSICSQFDKDDVEQAGLVKFDFLGLRNLTIIKDSLKIINSKLPEVEHVDIESISLEDENIYNMIASGNNNSIFQLESRGMSELSKKVKPSNFEDIVALVALYRPGPLESGMVDDFVDRKNKRQAISYPHPKYQHESLKPILESSYGILVYQEQVMKIAQVMGGYSLGGADILRKAMGKKLPAVMAEHRSIFVDGSVKNGYDAELAEQLFDLIIKFAGYGFNKSHSAAYALISYQTAWLKYYYPSAYMVAVMSSSMDKTSNLVPLIAECRRLKLQVEPPNINSSFFRFVVDDNDDNLIHYGLGAIKGIGSGLIEAITMERNRGGKYFDIFDFCNRNNQSALNTSTMESLIYAGALDCLIETRSQRDNNHLNHNRAILIAAKDEALKIAEQNRNNDEFGMDDLFGNISVVCDSTGNTYQRFQNVDPLGNTERLFFERNKLDLFLTGHPIEQYKDELDKYTDLQLSELDVYASTKTIGGWVVSIQRRVSQKGKPFATVVLDDQTGQVEFLLFSEQLEKYEQLLKIDTILLVKCQIMKDFRSKSNDHREEVDEAEQGYNLRINCKELSSLSIRRNELLKSLTIDIYESRNVDLDKLVTTLKMYANQNAQDHCVPVKYNYHTDTGIAPLNAGFKVVASQNLFEKIRHYCGTDALKLNY